MHEFFRDVGILRLLEFLRIFREMLGDSEIVTFSHRRKLVRR